MISNIEDLVNYSFNIFRSVTKLVNILPLLEDTRQLQYQSLPESEIINEVTLLEDFAKVIILKSSALLHVILHSRTSFKKIKPIIVGVIFYYFMWREERSIRCPPAI